MISEADRKKRLGIPTASQFHRVFTKNNRAATATGNTYKWELVGERIFGVPFGRDVTRFKAVQDGIANEDPARQALADLLKVRIEPAEFTFSQDRRFGCSPDGWIGRINRRPVEIKCPQLPGQLENLVVSPRKYWPQLQGQLLVTGADQVEFWSWSPYAPPAYWQIPRDTVFIDKLHRELMAFCLEVDKAEEAVRAAGKFDIEGFIASLPVEDENEEEPSECI